MQVLHSRSYQYQGRAQGPGFCECSVIRLDRGTLRVDRREFVDLGALSQDMGFNILARILEDNKHFHWDYFQKHGKKHDGSLKV